MIKAFLICILSFLMVEINSLSSSEKGFPCESFIRGGRRSFMGKFYPALQGVWAPVPRAPGLAGGNLSITGKWEEVKGEERREAVVGGGAPVYSSPVGSAAGPRPLLHPYCAVCPCMCPLTPWASFSASVKWEV